MICLIWLLRTLVARFACMSDMSETENVGENRLRRSTQRQGLLLVRSRQNDPRAFDLGRCVDIVTNTHVAGDQESGYGHHLNTVQCYLNRGL
jgi:hypothetical protein